MATQNPNQPAQTGSQQPNAGMLPKQQQQQQQQPAKPVYTDYASI